MASTNLFIRSNLLSSNMLTRFRPASHFFCNNSFGDYDGHAPNSSNEGVEKLNDARAMKKFDCEIRLPDNKYRISDIKAEMKMDLGELRVSVPKLKEEKGVFNV